MLFELLMLLTFSMMFLVGYTVYTPNADFTGQRAGVQFTDGKGEASKEEAELLVKQYGYSCQELFPESEDTIEPEQKVDKEPAEIIEEIFEDETVSLINHDGVLVPHPASKYNTNGELKAFMQAHSIHFDSDDNKPELNKKIIAWANAQLEESGKAQSD